MFRKAIYRIRQFWYALSAAPSPEELTKAQSVLNPEQYALFLELQPHEQAHALAVYCKLANYGEENPDLLQAALLHDIGKTRVHLRLWERVIIVLARYAFPTQVKQLGSGPPVGWRRPFTVSEQHPAWGAEMVSQTGAHPLTISLIRRHQDSLSEPRSLDEQLLLLLQRADDDS